MGSVNLIAAVGKSGQLGLMGKLPWHDAEDLKWFKKMTMNGFVIMGGNTLSHVPSLEGRLLVGWRRDIDPEGLIKTLTEMDPKRDIWIAGGAKTYRAFMPFVRRSFITHIEYDGPADVFLNLGTLTDPTA